MQRHRFYAPPSQITGSEIMLDEDESHHLSRVLRLDRGDRVFVFDGEGREYECEIEQAGKRESKLSVLNELSNPVESPLHLTLAQALIKSDKFDWVIQKATELGVTRIVPLITAHSDIKKADERAEQKRVRSRRISLEAVKQSGRRRLVEISEPLGFTEFTEQEIPKNNLFFSERGGISVHETAGQVDPLKKFNLYIAAEGGWSEAEINRAEGFGFVVVTLGSRILRTETAAIVAVTLAQHLFGDMP